MTTSIETCNAAVANSRAWYSASISDFLIGDTDSIIGQLATNGSFDLLQTQRNAWIDQICFLKNHLVSLDGFLFLEFTIPRLGRRIDTVLIIGPVIFVVEFKVGEKSFDRAAIDQVWDYALDLKNFHQASHLAFIVPILVATEATNSNYLELEADSDKTHRPMQVSAAQFREAIDSGLKSTFGEFIDPKGWAQSPYRPTPTIVEAARALYAQHSVEAIARFDAGTQNLRVTSRRVEEPSRRTRKIRRLEAVRPRHLLFANS